MWFFFGSDWNMLITRIYDGCYERLAHKTKVLEKSYYSRETLSLQCQNTRVTDVCQKQQNVIGKLGNSP